MAYKKTQRRRDLDHCIGCQWLGILKIVQFLIDDPLLIICLHTEIAHNVNKQMRAEFGKLNTHKIVVKTSEGRKYFAIKKIK